MRTPFKVLWVFIIALAGWAAYSSFTHPFGDASASGATARTAGNDVSATRPGSDYPTLETFSERWNVQPKFHDVDDQQAMAITQPWTNCNGSSDQSCMNVMVCSGHGSIRALRDDANNSYSYIFAINAENALSPVSLMSCPSGFQRLFNALYNSPAEAQEALSSFLGLREGTTSESYSETYDNIRYSVRWGKLNGAFFKISMPESAADLSLRDLPEFWSQHANIAILSKTNTRNAQP